MIVAAGRAALEHWQDGRSRARGCSHHDAGRQRVAASLRPNLERHPQALGPPSDSVSFASTMKPPTRMSISVLSDVPSVSCGPARSQVFATPNSARQIPERMAYPGSRSSSSPALSREERAPWLITHIHSLLPRVSQLLPPLLDLEVLGTRWRHCIRGRREPFLPGQHWRRRDSRFFTGVLLLRAVWFGLRCPSAGVIGALLVTAVDHVGNLFWMSAGVVR